MGSCWVIIKRVSPRGGARGLRRDGDMNRVTWLVFALVLALGLAGWSCTGESSDAKEQSSAADPSSAAEAYANLQQDLQGLQRGATSQQKLVEALGQSIVKLEEFIKTYPESDQAGDAVLQIAMVHAALGEFDKAIPHLEKFIAAADENEQQTGYAHFYLAESYKSVDRYDDAQKHYRLFLDKFSGLSPRVTAMATAALDDIPAMKRLSIGMEPIPFSVKDTAGKPLSIEKYEGKVVLLDFWASWCVPCKVEMPNVIRLYKKYNNRGFEIIGISLDSDEKAFENYVATNDMKWPQFFDGKGWQNEVAEKYKVRAIPATFLIGKDGKIRYRSLRGPELEKAIEKLLGEA
jgi:peroxiredoxin/predicted negative regulator of RcsB-dependent stress response